MMFEIAFGILLGFLLVHFVSSGSLPENLKFGKKGSWWKHYDDTDNRKTFDRSGLSLYIDHSTGLHYILAGLFGSIIPRLDKDGNHIKEE